jgi:hypothetical protein
MRRRRSRVEVVAGRLARAEAPPYPAASLAAREVEAGRLVIQPVEAAAPALWWSVSEEKDPA